MSAVIDRINQLEMNKPSIVRHYSSHDHLNLAEQAALDSVATVALERPILDIGVGGGRTTRSLLNVSQDYLGVDYSMGMVESCRARHPGVRFEHADARHLSGVADASIHLAMFSCNGIGMVSHPDRLRIFQEVHRVLEPGGVFLFSTHNLNCPDHEAPLMLPDLELSINPARTAVRLARFVRSTGVRLWRRASFWRHEIRTDEYAMVNGACHDYGVMLYCITLAKQREQIEALGFEKNAPAYDLSGQLIAHDTTDSSIMLVARKPLRP